MRQRTESRGANPDYFALISSIYNAEDSSFNRDIHPVI
jgi:hypothetical protein